MPNKNPRKRKQTKAKAQPEPGHAPSGGQLVTSHAATVDQVNRPQDEQQYEPKPEQRPSERPGQHQPPKPYRSIDKLNIGLTLLFSGLVVLFTGISTYYSSKQWEAVKQSLVDARETREIENRAYVVVKGIELLRAPIKLGEPNEGFVTYVNTGSTPARNVSFRSVARFIVPPLPNPPPLENLDPERAGSLIVAAPGVELRGSTSPFKVDEDQFVTDLADGKKTMFIYGVIKYTDIFDEVHETQFCGFYIPGIRSFRICPTFNDAN
jgi:hypothetical protein